MHINRGVSEGKDRRRSNTVGEQPKEELFFFSINL